MIMDELSGWRRYAGLLPGLPLAFEFLEKLDPSRPDGRYELDGTNVYCLIQRYQTKPATDVAFEAHRKYVDVQYILAGRETILWSPLAKLTTVTKPYAEEKDFTLFAPVPGSTPLRLNPGQFAILFPEDGHAPSLECDGPSDVIKAVVKVASRR